MLEHGDIDAVLQNAQAAVDALAQQAGTVAAPPSQAAARPSHEPAGPPVRKRPEGLPRNVDRILSLRVPVVVKLAERVMPAGDVMKLVPGTIIEFDRTVSSELDLLVNNTPIGTGQAIKVGEHFGLRVKFVGNVRERIQSLRAL